MVVTKKGSCITISESYYLWTEPNDRYKVPIDAVDTHRPKPAGTAKNTLDAPINSTTRQFEMTTENGEATLVQI